MYVISTAACLNHLPACDSCTRTADVFTSTNPVSDVCSSCCGMNMLLVPTTHPGTHVLLHVTAVTALRATRQLFGHAHLLYADLSLVYICAASGLAGLAQFGSVNKLCMLMSMVHTLWQGDHLSWMMSKQMLPSL